MLTVDGFEQLMLFYIVVILKSIFNAKRDESIDQTPAVVIKNIVQTYKYEITGNNFKMGVAFVDTVFVHQISH